MSEGAQHREMAPSNRAVIITLVSVLLLAYMLRLVLLPPVIAAAIAYVAGPAVYWLRRKLRFPRIAAVLAIYAMLLLVLCAIGWWFVTSLSGTVARASQELPQMINRLVGQFLGPEIHLFGQTFRADEISQEILDIAQTWVTQPGTAWTFGGLVIAAPATAVLTLVLLFYFLNSGRRLAEGTIWLAPPRYRGHIRHLARRIDPMLRHYVRGVLIVVAYTSAVAYVGLGLVFHLPFAALISVVVGALELIPVVGPAVSMALIGSSALLTGGGVWAFFWALVFAVGLRVSIDEIVGPLLLGRAVTLHPVVVILAFLIGATLFGILGVLLAVPVAASVKIVLGAWYEDDAARGGDAVAHKVPAALRE